MITRSKQTTHYATVTFLVLMTGAPYQTLSYCLGTYTYPDFVTVQLKFTNGYVTDASGWTVVVFPSPSSLSLSLSLSVSLSVSLSLSLFILH